MGKREDSQEHGTTELRKIRSESHIPLDMELVVTPGRSGFAGRALRRKAWSRCLFNPRRQSGGRPTPRPAGPPDWGGKEWEGRGAGAIRAALEEGSSVSRLSSRSPERAGSWGRAREPQRSLGVGRPWQRSRNQEVSGKNGEPRGQGGRSGGSSPGPEWPGQGRRGPPRTRRLLGEGSRSGESFVFR